MDSPEQNCTPSAISNWSQRVGVFDFLKGWREAFQVGVLVLATAGLVVSAIWKWLLDRLWTVSGAEVEPSRLFRFGFGDWDAVHLVFFGLREQWFYGLCLLIPLIFLWALIGGAIWRLLACQITDTSNPSISRALEYAIHHYWNGFFTAWILPAGFGLLVGVMIVAYGMFMAIPWLGDLVGGAFFFIPLALGCLLAFGVLVVFVGGNLFAPCVAVSGAEGADAVTHAVSFVLTRPIRAVLYFLATGLMVWVSSALLVYLVSLAETLTVGLVSLGEGMLSKRGDADIDRASAYLMGMWIGGLYYVVKGAIVGVYFAGSVVSFLLLRESVDGTDRREVCSE